LAKGGNPLEAALLAAVPLADLGLPTLILREDDHGYLGQIRHRAGDRHAHLACLAPIPRQEDNCWLSLIDGLVQTAGRRGAHFLRAEVPEHEEVALQILRRAGFMVVARQTLFRHAPHQPIHAGYPQRVSLRWATDDDTSRILHLQESLVPALVHHAEPSLEKADFEGLVVETLQEGRLVGYLDVIEGRSGIVLKPFMHPDIFEEEAARIFATAIRSLPKAERLPVYFCIMSYQEWLKTSCTVLELEEGERQVIFLKYTTVRNRQTDEILLNARDIVLNSFATAVPFQHLRESILSRDKEN
jgi:hypothetical protein